MQRPHSVECLPSVWGRAAPQNRMVFRHGDVMDYTIDQFEFVAQARRRKNVLLEGPHHAERETDGTQRVLLRRTRPVIALLLLQCTVEHNCIVAAREFACCWQPALMRSNCWDLLLLPYSANRRLRCPMRLGPRHPPHLCSQYTRAFSTIVTSGHARPLPASLRTIGSVRRTSAR